MKLKINKREISLISITLAGGILLGWAFFHDKGNESIHDHTEHTEIEETVYTCSMHPQIRQNKPGLCPICAMDLIPLETGISTEEHSDHGMIEMTDAALALASVQTSFVKKGKPEKVIHLLGKVVSNERKVAELTARFGGRIEELFINFTGQKVHKGERMASIYSPDLINARRELLEASRIKDSNPTLYEAARNRLRLWDLTDEQIEEMESSGDIPSNFELLAPISGTVTTKLVSEGDYVKEGSAMFEVADLSDLWVMFEAYESDLPWINQGDKIRYSFQSVPGEEFYGTVSYIDPVINPDTRVALIRIEHDNTSGKIKPGMFARGLMSSHMESMNGALMIPESAVLWTGLKAVVYVKVPGEENTSFQYREISLGPKAGNEYVVLEGLSEGEEIASNGVFRIDAAVQLSGRQSMMNVHKGTASSHPEHDAMIDTEKMSSQKTMQSRIMVRGNCGMCKDRIEETSLSLEGVSAASWDAETQILDISYDPDMLKETDIHRAVAAVGHDTELVRAPDSVYDELPACCKYSRD